MQKLNILKSISLTACGALMALSLSTPALAQHAVGHVGGGFHGGYGYHGGYGRGGYGWRGGYYGYRGGWGWYGPWGWGGLGLGLYFASLPLYYSTYYLDGVPYYYADNNYYRWDPGVRQYETVAPPAGLSAPADGQGGAGPASGAASTLMAYPKNGQSQDQQNKDKFECHRWAVGQTGFDPTQGTPAAGARRSDYYRAQAACLEGRGYSVK